MELTEAVQRIVRHHLLLILVLVVLGMSVPVVLQSGKDPVYEATARIDIDPGGTNTVDEAESLSDAARAIVTSPGHTAAAIDAANANRDPIDLADNHVDVQAVGTSGVLELSVTDGDPAVAARIADALAAELVEQRTAVILEPSRRQLVQIQEQVDAVNANSDFLVSRFGADATNERLIALQNSRESILQAQPNPPTVIDPARQPDDPVPTGLLAKVVIGGLLGLVLGLAIASLMEALNPTIIGADALARELGAPLVGRLPGRPDRAHAHTDLSTPAYVQLAAVGAGVEFVQLVSAGPTIDLQRLVGWLREAMGPSPDIDALTLEPRAAARWLDGSWPTASDNAGVGLVVVAPTVLHTRDLSAVEHLLAMTQWSLIGVIVYGGRRGRAVAANPPQEPPRAIGISSQPTRSAS